MTMRLRASFTIVLAVAIMGLSSCDHYNCSGGASFGGSCAASGGGPSGGGSGSGGSSAVALAYYLSNNEIGSLELSASGSTNTMISTPNFVMPTLPTGYTNAAATIVQKQFLYVPYSSTSSSPSLYAWSIDGTTGALTPVAGSPFAATYAAGLAIASQPTTPIVSNSAGTFLYIADAVGSQIDVFQVASSGVPTLLFQTNATISPWNLSIDGLGKFLYVTEGAASGEGVQMEVFSINSTTGALSGGTTMPINMWQVQGEPTGQFMIGVDGLTGLTGDNKPADPNVYVFGINGSNGVLTQVGKFATGTGNGPTGVAVDPNGKYVYDFSLTISTGLDGPLDGFSLNTTTGALTSLAPVANTLSAPEFGVFDQSGSYLFFHASSAIGVYSIDPTTGIATEPTAPLGVGSGAVIYPWAVTDPM